MSSLDGLRYRAATLWRALTDRAGWRRDVDDEIAFHLELEAMHRRHGGASDAEARRAARRRFGRPERVRERLADATGVAALDVFAHEVRLAARALRRSPAFTLVGVATLALAIGANTLVFSAVRGMIARPLPFPSAERLVWVQGRDATARASRETVSADAVARLFDGARPFDGWAAIGDAALTREEGERPSQWRGLRVTRGLFELLGVRPALGRAFTAAEARGAARVVLIGHERWRRDFGGDSSVVGRALRLGEQHLTVVGVLPPGLDFPLGRAPLAGNGAGYRPGEQDFWLPSDDRLASGTVLARLASGATVGDAARHAAAVQRRVHAEVPGTPATGSLVVVPLRDQILGPARPALRLLQAFAALVLLLACANLASLVLARGTVRAREFRVRAALGASPAAVVRVILAECLLLAAAGGASGVLVAAAGRAALGRAAAGRLPLLDRVAVDGPAMVFALLAGAATIALFAVAPAIAVARGARPGAGAGSRGHSATARQARVRGALVIAQVSIALTLLAGATLVGRSLARLLAVDTGYETERVIVADVQLAGGKGYVDFYRALTRRLLALPGVASVGMIQSTPFTGKWTFTEPFVVEGRGDPAGAPQVPGSLVAFDYFGAMGVDVVAGRAFTEAEYVEGSTPALVINETAARRFFPSASPLGASVSLGGRRRTVVGVVRDTRDVRLDAPAGPQWYEAMFFEGTQLVIRTAGEPARRVPAVRALLDASDRRMIVHRVEPLVNVVEGTVVERRVAMRLLAAFAGVGVAVAVTGLYGLLSFVVAQRRRELGVRRALGATRHAIVAMVLGHGVALAAAGVALGTVAALSLGALLRGLLFETSPRDPVTYAATVAALLVVAAAAAAGPAWRAATADPLTVLRAD